MGKTILKQQFSGIGPEALEDSDFWEKENICESQISPGFESRHTLDHTSRKWHLSQDGNLPELKGLRLNLRQLKQLEFEEQSTEESEAAQCGNCQKSMWQLTRVYGWWLGCTRLDSVRPKGIACHAAKSRTDTRGHTVLRDMCVWAQLKWRDLTEHTKHSFETPGRACLTGKKPCPRLLAIFKDKR